MSNDNDIEEKPILTESELKDSYKKLLMRATYTAILIPATAFFYFVIYIPLRVEESSNEISIFIMSVIIPLLVYAMLACFGIIAICSIIMALMIKKRIISKEFK